MSAPIPTLAELIAESIRAGYAAAPPPGVTAAEILARPLSEFSVDRRSALEAPTRIMPTPFTDAGEGEDDEEEEEEEIAPASVAAMAAAGGGGGGTPKPTVSVGEDDYDPHACDACGRTGACDCDFSVCHACGVMYLSTFSHHFGGFCSGACASARYCFCCGA